MIEEETKNTEPTNGISPEVRETHPELSHEIKKSVPRFSKYMRQHRRKNYPVRYIWLLNLPIITNVIIGASIFLGMAYIYFGVMGALTLLGLTENKTWIFYQVMWIFGWEGNAVTGIALIIIGLIILWSIPYYLRDKTQQADSYLIIGSGLGVLFCIIYILIIFADLLIWLVNFLSTSVAQPPETYFYYPIMLGLVTAFLFRTLMIRHIVLPPTETQPEDYSVQRYRREMRQWKEDYKKMYQEEYNQRWQEWKDHRHRRHTKAARPPRPRKQHKRGRKGRK